MAKPIYTAIFLTEEAKETLKKLYPPKHPKVYADHVTLVFKPTPEQIAFLAPFMDQVAVFQVTGVISDEKGQAAKVTIPGNLQVPGQHLHHITISCAEGVSPVYSNELLLRGWEVHPSVDLSGVVRHYFT